MTKANVPLAPIIKRVCKNLEREEGITILFAIENGSRAWRMESSDSDYDVRFVYARPLAHYISLKKSRDVIERNYDATGKMSDDVVIDLVGFDVTKFLALLSKSNPTMIEWIMSDIVYVGKPSAPMKKFATRECNPLALYHHYKSLSRQNYEKYITSGLHVSFKKYLYVYRGLINAKYVQQKGTVPPIELLAALKEIDVPKRVRQKIHSIIEIKKSGRELGKVNRVAYLDAYVEKFMREVPGVHARKSNVTLLDTELKRILLK
jgi:predicted nucleotidyltransferase